MVSEWKILSLHIFQLDFLKIKNIALSTNNLNVKAHEALITIWKKATGIQDNITNNKYINLIASIGSI
ncbi:hypothetical protein RIR_jg19155.t1 [Rhizophagus irregularis DAOM 181602=DAOM 197198]|nr:hypothetical protein RIR_jg19155.t1 [Rhizophagus irregularis DAOM 181602=DAOM 197198]